MSNEAHDRRLYKYPGSEVFRNKLNVRDGAVLDRPSADWSRFEFAKAHPLASLISPTSKRSTATCFKTSTIGQVSFGNGRTQTQYLKQLATRAGHLLDLRRMRRDEWMDASRQTHQGDYKAMGACIRAMLREA